MCELESRELRHLTPELIHALDELIDRAVTFGGDYAQAWLCVQVEKRQVRQLRLLLTPFVNPFSISTLHRIQLDNRSFPLTCHE